MNVTSVPPMKPVLVTDVSDDISTLRKDDVTKQRTILTARAVDDLFKCAPIRRTGDDTLIHPDNAYFVYGNHFNRGDEWAVDLNKIVTAQSRRLEEQRYINGPSINKLTLVDQYPAEIENMPETTEAEKAAKAEAKNAIKQWSSAHNAKILSVAGFLYVYSVLDDSTLVWDNWDGVISMEDKLSSSTDPHEPDTTTGENTESKVEIDNDINFRSVKARTPSPRVRQIFIGTNTNDYLTYDGTKASNDTLLGSSKYYNRTRYNQGIPFTRVGKYNSTTGEYDWEPWYEMTKIHDGPEYFTNILVEGSTPSGTYKHFGVSTSGTTLIETPLVDAVYHIYTQVDNFTLPNANLDAYKPGQKIIVEVHPPRNPSSTTVPHCRVNYKDTFDRGADAGTAQMTIMMTPRVRRNTKNVYGAVRDDHLITSVAVFEIVEHKDKDGNTYRTWELDAGVEETDFTAGMAQMLGEHTDTAVYDIVQLTLSEWTNVRTVDVAYPVTTSGYVIADFLKKSGITDDTSFEAVVQVVTPTSDAVFDRVTDNDTTPNGALIYYTRENSTWQLAENNGHPTSFLATKEYYSIDTTSASRANVTEYYEGSTHYTSVKMAQLVTGKKRRFAAYAHRGAIIHVRITSNQNMSKYQNKLFPVVGFYPDPHDSYVHKASVNQSAYTRDQLTKLFNDGSIIGDILLSLDDNTYRGVLNAPVSTRALLDAYAYLATKLQNKGLLLGSIYSGTDTTDGYGGLMDIAAAGSYWITPKTPVQLSNDFPPDMVVSGSTAEGFSLVVINNERTSNDVIHENDDGVVITPADKAMQIALIMHDDEPTINYRSGTYNSSTSKWVWGPWKRLNDWADIRNKPEFYKGRWDYFRDPNDILNFIDQNTNVSNKCTVVSAKVGSVGERRCSILKTYIAGVMSAYVETDDENTDVRRTSRINYKIPQIMIGIHNLAASSASLPSGITSKRYAIEVNLPDAVVTPASTSDDYDKRRKVRILFYGRPDVTSAKGWDETVVRVKYSSSDGATAYSYERNWGTNDPTGVGPTSNYPSILDLTFEQIDIPNGDRIWSPVEVG